MEYFGFAAMAAVAALIGGQWWRRRHVRRARSGRGPGSVDLDEASAFREAHHRPRAPYDQFPQG